MLTLLSCKYWFYPLNVFRRKSLTGNWKTNVGQSILEEVPVQDHHKSWIDLVSQMFGGLDICSLEALVAKDGQEHIIEVNDPNIFKDYFS